MVPLTELLRAVPTARAAGLEGLLVCDIAYDSRAVTPGSLFIAVPTVGGDDWSGGVRFIPQAVSRGAVAVVLQGDAPVEGVPAIRVSNARAALADLAAEFFGHPSRRLALYAVTGTDGKTTTTYLLEGALAHAGYTTGRIGTVETKIGGTVQRHPDRMTTPEAPDVQRLLRAMVDAGVTHAAIEASSHALALQRLRSCTFAAAAVTNITADHLEFHGSWEAYFGAKASLFSDVARGKPAILNRDDPSFERLRRLTAGPVMSYSLMGDADIVARNIRPEGKGIAFTLQMEGRNAPARLALGGIYNIANALAAAGLARTAGLSVPEIAEGLSAASPPPGRMEHVDLGQPFDVVIDYAHTANAFESILAAVRERTPGCVIAVFGAAGNRDRAKRPLFAQIASRYADLAIVTNEDPFGEQAEAIIDEVLSGVPAGTPEERFARESDRGRAIERAVREAQAGDTVVILGKGHEQSIAVNGIQVPWSDVAVARAALEGLL